MRILFIALATALLLPAPLEVLSATGQKTSAQKPAARPAAKAKVRARTRKRSKPAPKPVPVKPMPKPPAPKPVPHAVVPPVRLPPMNVMFVLDASTPSGEPVPALRSRADAVVSSMTRLQSKLPKETKYGLIVFDANADPKVHLKEVEPVIGLAPNNQDAVVQEAKRQLASPSRQGFVGRAVHAAVQKTRDLGSINTVVLYSAGCCVPKAAQAEFARLTDELDMASDVTVDVVDFAGAAHPAQLRVLQKVADAHHGKLFRPEDDSLAHEITQQHPSPNEIRYHVRVPPPQVQTIKLRKPRNP